MIYVNLKCRTTHHGNDMDSMDVDHVGDSGPPPDGVPLDLVRDWERVATLVLAYAASISSISSSSSSVPVQHHAMTLNGNGRCDSVGAEEVGGTAAMDISDMDISSVLDEAGGGDISSVGEAADAQAAFLPIPEPPTAALPLPTTTTLPLVVLSGSESEESLHVDLLRELAVSAAMHEFDTVLRRCTEKSGEPQKNGSPKTAAAESMLCSITTSYRRLRGLLVGSIGGFGNYAQFGRCGLL